MQGEQQTAGEDSEGPPRTPAGLADERFAANVRELRERNDMSQADLAREMTNWRWYPQTVHRVEAGQRKVSVGEAKALAEILHTTVDRLTWPGREASAAALLDTTTARAESAYEQIAAWTASLLWAQHQLSATVADEERAGYLGSARIRELVQSARGAMKLTPEQAIADGRHDHEELRRAARESADGNL